MDFGPHCALGPGKIALLENIERTGSLSAAARALRMSYRRGWLLLEDLNTSFATPVAQLSVGGRGGGGASLTTFGRELVAAYRAFAAHVISHAQGAFPPETRSVGGERRHQAVSRRRINRSGPPKMQRGR